ncbi:MAG: MlaD family protein [Verrucomicrobia bacterium]|nr:MlaD family protein [Verrucomicrobiota bacterium]
MKRTPAEWKVGVFVVISLALMMAAAIQFSKGSPLFAETMNIRMRLSNVGGIIPGADVLMAGVPIGTVSDIQLDPGGRLVTIHLRILAKYQIHADAQFSIRQSGFLGDRHVSVVPTDNQKPVLVEGAEIRAEEPLDLEEVARSAAGLLQSVDDTAKNLNATVARIDRILFNEQTLTNLSAIVANFHSISEKSLTALNSVNQFVRTNSHPLNASVSNLVVFSGELNQVAVELREIVATNRSEATRAIKNIESATMQIDQLTRDLQAGKGVIGNLLKNEALEVRFLNTMENLGVLSSNLSRHGLLWKPKREGNSDARAPYTGRNPNR